MSNDFFAKYEDNLYLMFRIIFGLMFFFHGASKFGIIGDNRISGFAAAFGFPLWLAILVGCIELLGGMFILLGLFVRPAAIGSSIVMISALFIAHFPKGYYPLANGGELPFLFLAGFLVLISKGARKFSLEKAIFNKELF